MAEQQGPKPLDTGGIQLGHWGGFQAYVPGFKALTSAATDVAPVVAGGLVKRKEEQMKAAKDYNDAEASTTAGVEQGQAVEKPPPSPFPEF